MHNQHCTLHNEIKTHAQWAICNVQQIIKQSSSQALGKVVGKWTNCGSGSEQKNFSKLRAWSVSAGYQLTCMCGGNRNLVTKENQAFRRLLGGDLDWGKVDTNYRIPLLFPVQGKGQSLESEKRGWNNEVVKVKVKTKSLFAQCSLVSQRHYNPNGDELNLQQVIFMNLTR